MSFQELPYLRRAHSPEASLPLTYREHHGIDESGSMEYQQDCVVLNFMGRKPGSIVPRPPRSKLRKDDLNGKEPYGNFRFLVLKPEMLEIARSIFPEPTTFNDVRLGELYYQYKLRSWAIPHLLTGSGFNPWTDIAVVDAYGNDGMRKDVLYSLSRSYGRHVPRDCVVFVPDADRTIPAVMNADTNAILVRRDATAFEDRRIPLTNDDVTKFGIQYMQFNDAFPYDPSGMTLH